MRLKTTLLLIVGILFAQFAAHAPAEDATAAPTKEQAVALLKDLLAALEAKDYDKAFSYMHLPEAAPKDKIKNDELPKLLDRKELSAAGIEKLAAGGKWGPLAEVAGQERAERIATKFEVPLDKCFGLYLEPAETAFYLVDGSLKIIRCDDVGKLGEAE